MSTTDHVEDLTEYREVAERARVDTDVSDHLLTIFRESLAARPRLIVELGVRSGESTFVLERVARLTGATLVSVDLEDCSRVSPWERWHFVHSDDVVFAGAFDAWCRARGIEPKVDVLFIDTSHEHEHTRREIAAWLPHLAPRARAIFHDTNLKRVVRRRDGRVHPCPFEQRGVTRALEEFLGAALDETRDFTLVRGEWTVRHDSCCHGLTVLERDAAPQGVKPPAVVFCERLENESFCESVVRELSSSYDVRPCGPGWPVARLDQVDATGARFYLELDAASGSFVRPEGLERLKAPKFAWLIDTHKKPSFHAQIARDMDVTFYAHKVWGHIFQTPARWLPLHADQQVFRPVDSERDLDLVFVGSQEWRADPLRRIAEKHGLRLHVSCTTGAREKSETAALYARAKLVFNRHCANDLNFRVFEAMSCGRVVLTDAQWNGQYELFEDGRHYVLYKDERDLERQILHYLQDDVARARIEADAAALAAREHTTRARVRQLVVAIEGALGEHVKLLPEPASPRISVPARARPTPPAERTKRHWLFFVGDKPATVERKTYAERLAWGLARAGDEVVVARARRTVLPRRGARAAGEPLTIEIDPGPLPEALSVPNRTLAEAAALQAGLDRLAREHGPFDALVGEGFAGGLAAEPLGVRLSRPFLLALDTCEVARCGNRLTREQLNVAELEHWFADRAAAVLTPTPEVAIAVSNFYKNVRARAVAPSAPRLRPATEPWRLAARFGLKPRSYLLVLSGNLGAREKSALAHGAAVPMVLAADDVRLATTGSATRVLARTGARGGALAALLSAASGVVAVDAADFRVAEARALGCRVALVDPTEAVARGAPFLVQAVQTAPEAVTAPTLGDDMSALEAILGGIVTDTGPVRATSSAAWSEKEAEVALLL